MRSARSAIYMDMQRARHIVIHQAVGFDDNIRKDLLPDGNAQNTSSHGCQKRIIEIFEAMAYFP